VGVDQFPNSVATSALSGQGLPELMTEVESILEDQMAHVDVLIPYEQGSLVDLFHRRGLIQAEEHTDQGTRIAGLIPCELVGHFQELHRVAPRS
jgi:GTP-binding protein HflX